MALHSISFVNYFGIAIYFSWISYASTYCTVSTPLVFTVEPVGLTVKEGDNATFTCAVSIANNGVGQIAWHVTPNVYQTKHYENYDPVKQEVSSTLTVFNIGKDEQYVSCTFTKERMRHEIPKYQDNICYTSGRATMKVRYFPTSGDFTCSPKNVSALRVRDILPVQCVVPRGNPAVDMNWILLQSDGIDLPRPRAFDKGVARILQHGLVIHQKLDMQTIICLVTSEATFPGKRLECSIGPIRVYHSPHVTVQPWLINDTKPDFLELLCVANGYPEVVDFMWSCSPSGILRGCNATSNRITLFYRDESYANCRHHERIVVTCLASNSEGSGIGLAHIPIQKSSLHIGYVEFSIQERRISPLLHVTILQDELDGNIKLLCLAYTQDDAQSKVHFHWYLQDTLINENDDMFAVEINSPLSSSLISQNHSLFEINKAVTCKATVDNDTKEASLCINNDFLMDKMTPTPKRHPSTKLTTEISARSVIFTKAFSFSGSKYARRTTSGLLSFDVNTTIIETVGYVNEEITQSYHLSMRHIVAIVISCVVLTVGTFSCCLIVMRRYSAHETLLNAKTPKVDATNPNNKEGHSDDGSLSDPVYEVPKLLSVFNHVEQRPLGEDIGSCSSHPSSLIHTYDCGMFLPSPFGTSSEHSSSWTSSADSSTAPGSTESIGLYYNQTSNAALYANHNVVQMHSRTGQNETCLCSDVAREQVIEKCMNIPLPPLPIPILSGDYGDRSLQRFSLTETGLNTYEISRM